MDKTKEFVSRLRVEPYIFFYSFSLAIEGMTITQLAQDKICRNTHQLPEDVCRHLSTADEAFPAKNQILSEVASFGLQVTLITAIPIVLWSLFLGSWADRHPNSRKLLLMVAIVASVLESILLIVNAYFFHWSTLLLITSFVPKGLTGGLLPVSLAIYSYVSATTTPKTRTIRFAVLEVFIFISTPIGVFIGGKIIATDAIGSGGQLHNYLLVFFISLASRIMALIWMAIITLETPAIKPDLKLDFDESKLLSADEAEVLIRAEAIRQSGNPSKDPPPNARRMVSIEKKEKVGLSMFSDLFEIDNIKQMVITCCKKRDDYRRVQIWMIFLAMTCFTMAINAPNPVTYPYVERMFKWTAETMSMVTSGVLLASSLAVGIVVPIMVKCFKLSDPMISLIGTMSMFLSNLVRGSTTTVTWFITAYALGLLNSVPPITIRSYITSIIGKDEINRVFGLMATFEAITPILASTMATPIFQATIDSHPGAVFQVIAGILVIPIFIFLTIDVFNWKRNRVVNDIID